MLNYFFQFFKFSNKKLISLEKVNQLIKKLITLNKFKVN